MHNDWMNNENSEYNEETFSSFLGGIFLTRRTISNFEFFSLLEKFQDKYNVYIIDDDLNIKIDTSNNCISMVDDYDDFVFYKSKRMTVRNYLYAITTPNVRDFFELPSMNDTNFISLVFKKLSKKRSFI